MSEKYNELLNRKPNVFSTDNYAVEKRPTLRNSDYDVGYFTRFFAQKYDADSPTKIIEIDKKQYKSWQKSFGGLKKSYYNVLKFQWKISGNRKDVIVANYKTINKHKDSFPGLPNKLTDVLEFWEGKEYNNEAVSYFEAKQLLDANNRDE